MTTPKPLSLSALLSRVLIAYTLDFDRELDARRRTTSSKEPAPSLAMWSNVLRFVGEDGVEERRLPSLSGVSKPVTHSMVACLTRHGWVTVESSDANKRANIIRFTERGSELARVWESAASDVERHWAERYGAQTVDALRLALANIASQLDDALPQYPMAIAHRGGTPTGH